MVIGVAVSPSVFDFIGRGGAVNTQLDVMARSELKGMRQHYNIMPGIGAEVVPAVPEVKLGCTKGRAIA